MTRTELDAFAPLDWALLAAVALMWGSSFLLMAIGLEDLEPPLVTFGRILFGALALAAIPGARRSVPRAELPGVALLGLVWMAVPFLLFPVAQQWIDSSLAGMINGAAPLFTAVVATILLRRLPGRVQRAGLAVGFLGVVAVSWPAVRGAEATALGAGLVLGATMLYGVAFNLAVPLQRRHGALPVLWRAQLVALVLVAPFAAAGLGESTLTGSAVAAMAALGALGTGLAFVAFTTLVGRVGAARGSVATYLVPLVAIVLGVALRDESMAAIQVLGAGLVIVGAVLTSRRERPATAGASGPGASGSELARAG